MFTAGRGTKDGVFVLTVCVEIVRLRLAFPLLSPMSPFVHPE